MGLFSKKTQNQAMPTAPGVPVALPNSNLNKGTVSLLDVIAPSSVEVDFKFVRIGNLFYRTFFVVGYPRYVSANWLQPLIDFDHSLDISMFIYPVMVDDVLSNLKRRIGEMEATIASDEENGKMVDPKVSSQLSDALALQQELAKGIERFFQFSLYITLSAPTIGELEEVSRKLSTTLSSILLAIKTATLQMESGFKTSLPIGQDRLFLVRNMDTSSLASTFPFTSATLTQDKGVMYGVNQQNGSLILFDRFSMENANEVVFGKSGSGKSFFIKLEIMRQFMFGTEVIIIDPEHEYGLLSQTLGGELIQFSTSSPITINPFDLTGKYEEGENELGLKILSLHGILKIMFGDIDPAMDAILDRALVETYAQKGITQDPATQLKEPPIMEDLYNTLLGMQEPQAQDLSLRLERYVKGSLNGLFNQQSNFDISNPLTIFSIQGLEDELRPIVMHIILDFVWTRVRKTLKKRLLIVDEAWIMMQYADSASFIYGVAKRARKYFLGLTTATQDVEDFLSSDYGKAILTNSSIQVLLKQSPSEINHVVETFFLSEGEKQLLLSAGVGQGIFFAGQNHVALQVVAAPFEHDIITSNPEEIMKQQQAALAAQQNAQNTVAPANPYTPPPVPNQ
ncbi:MAG TPA: DUF87 domain-containing protein [Candidatus Saccharimonadales bacterium]|nr:DUF87 domain-containing protein [Candidatus Saccharimonadales bacterium]